MLVATLCFATFLQLFVQSDRSRRAGPNPAAPEVRWWLVDDHSGSLIGLDGGLGVVRRQALAGIQRVRCGSDPESPVWALVSCPAWDELVRLPPRGSPSAGVPVFERVLELAVDRGDGLWFLAQDARGAVRLDRLEPEGRPRTRALAPHARHLAPSGEHVLVASDAGLLGLFAFQEPPALRAREVGGGPARALARAPRGWWLLEGDTELGLVRLESDLSRRWIRSIQTQGELLLTADPERDAAWVVETPRGRVRRYSGQGGRELDVLLPAAGPTAVCADGEGGVLVATPGALFLLDADGRLRRTQGGFERIADVARAP